MTIYPAVAWWVKKCFGRNFDKMATGMMYEIKVVLLKKFYQSPLHLSRRAKLSRHNLCHEVGSSCFLSR